MTQIVLEVKDGMVEPHGIPKGTQVLIKDYITPDGPASDDPMVLQDSKGSFVQHLFVNPEDVPEEQ